jgi:hypothetical protein
LQQGAEVLMGPIVEDAGQAMDVQAIIVNLGLGLKARSVFSAMVLSHDSADVC